MEQKTVEERLQSALMKIKEQGGGSCRVLYEEVQKDPIIKAAIEKFEVDAGVDILLVRLPVIGAFRMANSVAEQANDKYNQGDYIGAASNYSAALATGIAHLWGAGDIAIEYMRDMGADLNPSPARKGYNTLMGTYKVCKNLDIRMAKALEDFPTTQQPTVNPDVHAALSTLTRDQAEAMARVAERVAGAYRETKRTLTGHDLGTMQPPPAAASGVRRESGQVVR